ncbi:ATP-binding cassette domain-containing protein [Bdellovibrio sp. HCB337]|uniref:ABC transporter ATP-binding protein n=1 Tax=Bdellovibrio sp. HCB337 TaxID=3394358 RepID=UPI0039A58548
MLSISVRNLSKTYPQRHKKSETFYAVRDLNFDIQEGEVVAFLGPNGAGKSTTIKMLCGILTPSEGNAKIMGLPAGSRDANKLLGLVFGTRSQLYMHMTVYESLDLIAEIYYVTGAEKKKRIQHLAELFQIEMHLQSRVRTLSLGERMRCELVAALIHRPRVLLADEPTIGLDVVAKNKLRELIRQWQQEEKTTLLLTSHDLSDVEALCHRCILVDHGQKQFDGPLVGVKGDLQGVRRLQITVAESHIASLQTDARIQSLNSGNDFIHKYEMHTSQIPMTETISRLSQHYGDALQDLQILEVSLEEVLGNRFAQKGQR